MTTARDIMNAGVTCVGEHETLTAAAQYMREHDIGALPICGDDDRLHGMLTDRDIVIKGLAAGLDPNTATAGELASGTASTTSMRTQASRRCSTSWKNIRSAVFRSSQSTAWSESSPKPTSPDTCPSTPLCSSSRQSARPWPSPASDLGSSAGTKGFIRQHRRYPMRDAIPLGRIAGFVVNVHWSVLVILWLFTWSLATMLPGTVGGYPAVVYWLLGAGGAVMLLASLLAHELAHAVVARRAGVSVESVTLWLFGGVTALGGEAKTPKAAFRIAFAGPATSLALSATFGALAITLAGVRTPAIVISVAWWLATVNLLLGLFNLLPGAPLDGGRLVRPICGAATAIVCAPGSVRRGPDGWLRWS